MEMKEWDKWIRKYKKTMEKMYYFFLALILVYNALASTPLILMAETGFTKLLKDLPEGLPGALFQMLLSVRLLIVIPALYTLFFEVKGRKKKILLIGLLLLGWFYAYYWRDKNDTVVFEALLLICASTGRDFGKIARYSICIISSIMILAFCLFLAGILPDYTMMRGDWIRHAFGTMHCTDLAAHWCFVILTFIFLKKGDLSRKAYGVIVLLTVLNLLFVDGRTAYLCVIAAMVGSILYTLYQKKQWKIPEGLLKAWRWILCFSYLGFAALYMILNFTYRNDPNAFYNRIPVLKNLSYRLDTSYRVTRVLPFSWFGKYFLQIGDGMGLSEKYGLYTFLDCSYVRVYVMYGIVAFVLFLTILTLIQVRLLKEKKTFSMFLLALVAFSCFLEHHMLEMGYNIFLLLLFADLSCLECPEKKEGVREKAGAL